MDHADASPANPSPIAQRRRLLGLAQGELASRCGVSRQFLSLVESGKTLPNVQIALQLAAELQCRVEELFGRAEARATEPLAVQVVPPQLPTGTRLALGQVQGRWVAHPADTPETLGSGFQVGDATLAWVEGQAHARPVRPLAELETRLLIAGCDPALALLAQEPPRLSSGAPVGCTWVNCGSGRAIELLAQGLVHVAGLHYSGQDAHDNRHYVRQLDPTEQWQMFHFTRWENGWLIRPEAVRAFRSVTDLAERKLRLANREPGTANRQWLDTSLQTAGIAPNELPGYNFVQASHWECARALRTNQADLALGPRALAVPFGLAFVPVAEVTFDLVIPKNLLGLPSIQALLQHLRSRPFTRQIDSLAGYSAPAAGDVVG